MRRTKVFSVFCILMTVIIACSCASQRASIVGNWATKEKYDWSYFKLNILASGTIISKQYGDDSLNGTGTWEKVSDGRYIVILKTVGYSTETWELQLKPDGTLEMSRDSGWNRNFTFYRTDP